MILSDRDIREALDRKRLGVDPLEDHQIQPASIDLTLAWPPKILEQTRSVHDILAGHGRRILDPENPTNLEWVSACSASQRRWILSPGTLVLASTEQTIKIANGLGAHINGLSSLGRLGLHIHASCSWFDPGFEGTAVLEILQTGQNPIYLHRGMRIAQLIVHQTTSESLRPYGHHELRNKYWGQNGTTPARG